MSSDQDYAQAMAKEVLRELIGGRITKVFVTPADEYSPDGFGFIVSKNGKHKTVCVLMDPEGNGPGFLDIQLAE